MLKNADIFEKCASSFVGIYALWMLTWFRFYGLGMVLIVPLSLLLLGFVYGIFLRRLWAFYGICVVYLSVSGLLLVGSLAGFRMLAFGHTMRIPLLLLFLSVVCLGIGLLFAVSIRNKKRAASLGLSD